MALDCVKKVDKNKATPGYQKGFFKNMTEL